MSVKKGDKIKIDYEGSFDDGSVFDSSEKTGQALEFEVGSGHVIQGFDDAVVGMEVGDEKTFRLTPDEAYGPHNPELIKEIPRNQIPEGEQEPRPGMLLILSLPSGEQAPALITAVTDEKVTIDLNHILAGKDLNFKIKLLDIVE